MKYFNVFWHIVNSQYVLWRTIVYKIVHGRNHTISGRNSPILSASCYERHIIVIIIVFIAPYSFNILIYMWGLMQSKRFDAKGKLITIIIKSIFSLPNVSRHPSDAQYCPIVCRMNNERDKYIFFYNRRHVLLQYSKITTENKYRFHR